MRCAFLGQMRGHSAGCFLCVMLLQPGALWKPTSFPCCVFLDPQIIFMLLLLLSNSARSYFKMFKWKSYPTFLQESHKHQMQTRSLPILLLINPKEIHLSICCLFYIPISITASPTPALLTHHCPFDPFHHCCSQHSSLLPPSPLCKHSSHLFMLYAYFIFLPS